MKIIKAFLPPILFLLIFNISFGCISIAAKGGPQPVKLIKMLVFSKTTGYRHESIPTGKLALIKLGLEHGFTVDTTENGDAFNDANLKNYQVVVFLSTTHRVLDTVQKAALASWIHHGGGFVGIHAATDTEYGWPYYNKLIGAWFSGHPGPNNVRQGTLHVEDKNDISTKEMPSEFTRTDEWYNFKDFQADNHVLVSIDQTTYNFGTDKKHPVSWCRTYDGGRIFYTSMGHTKETYSEPLFLKHLWGGIQYVLGKK